MSLKTREGINIEKGNENLEDDVQEEVKDRDSQG